MGLSEKIQEEIQKALAANQITEKKHRFPFGKKVGRSQKPKNFVTILLLNENGTYTFKKYQIEEQTIMHDLIPRLASAGHVMFDKKGNPLMILPNWSVEPFSPLDHYNKTIKEGSNTKGFQILMAKMQSEIVSGKKKIGGALKWIIGGALGLIIVYALVSGGGA